MNGGDLLQVGRACNCSWSPCMLLHSSSREAARRSLCAWTVSSCDQHHQKLLMIQNRFSMQTEAEVQHFSKTGRVGLRPIMLVASKHPCRLDVEMEDEIAEKEKD